MRDKLVISLFDESGNMVRPWAEDGYECHCFDLLNTDRVERFPSGGAIYFWAWDAFKPDAHHGMINACKSGDLAASYDGEFDVFGNVAMVFSFAPCTDLAASGARWWKEKAKADPDFQKTALKLVVWASNLANYIDADAYMIENPQGAITRLWRKWDYAFDPCDFGGYLPEDDVHPRFPEIIPARDAYPKRTCLWTGGAFVFPEKNRVEPVTKTYTRKDGTTTTFSQVSAMTGGKSEKTKQVRSETPRGFARAVFLANGR